MTGGCVLLTISQPRLEKNGHATIILCIQDCLMLPAWMASHVRKHMPSLVSVPALVKHDRIFVNAGWALTAVSHTVLGRLFCPPTWVHFQNLTKRGAALILSRTRNRHIGNFFLFFRCPPASKRDEVVLVVVKRAAKNAQGHSLLLHSIIKVVVTKTQTLASQWSRLIN